MPADTKPVGTLVGVIAFNRLMYNQEQALHFLYVSTTLKLFNATRRLT